MQLRHIILLAALGMVPALSVAAEYDGERNADQLFHGQGTYRDDDGAVYVGQWRDGLRYGQGVMTWANGDRYEGEFKNDVRDGKGVFIRADGTRISGVWKDDTMQGEPTVAYAATTREVGKVEALLIDVPSSRMVDHSVNMGPVPAKRVADAGAVPAGSTVADAVRAIQQNPPAAGRSDQVALTIKSADTPRFSLDKAAQVVGTAVNNVLYAAHHPQNLELHVDSPALGIHLSLAGYRGPGQYLTDTFKVSFNDAGKNYQSVKGEPAKIDITFDDGKVVKGVLRVVTYKDGKAGSADRREFTSAEFVLPSRP